VNSLTFGFLPKTLRIIIRLPLISWYIFLSGLILDRLYRIFGFEKIFKWDEQQTFIIILISFTVPQLISLILRIFFYNNSRIDK
jgi:hypothetical protein